MTITIGYDNIKAINEAYMKAITSSLGIPSGLLKQTAQQTARGIPSKKEFTQLMREHIKKSHKVAFDTGRAYEWEFSQQEPCPSCQPKRKSLITELFDELHNQGYHEDIIERCKFALLSPQGFEVFTNLPKKFDYEYLVQTLLGVYKDITS